MWLDTGEIIGSLLLGRGLKSLVVLPLGGDLAASAYEVGLDLESIIVEGTKRFAKRAKHSPTDAE